MPEKTPKKSGSWRGKTKLPNLFVMPPRKWTNQEEVVKLAEGLLDAAKSGRIQSLAYVAERNDDAFESGATRLQNCFGTAGYLFSLGIRLMGFNDDRDRKPTS